MLLRRFALVSVAATALFLLALGMALSSVLHHHTLYFFRNEVADAILASARHHLDPALLAGPPRVLGEHLEMVAGGARARAIRLYDATGRQLWPPAVPDRREGSPEHRAFLRRALAGERIVLVERRRPTGGSAPEPVLESYLPLSESGRLYGVLETEVPGNLLATVQRRLSYSVLALVAAGFLLWAVLLTLVRSASRTLDRQHAELRQSHELLAQRFQDLLNVMVAAVDAKDSYTFGHSLRVAAVSRLIGQAMGLKDEELANLELGALLHDIDKIGVSDAVLRKSTRLNHAEMLEMRRHPAVGMALLDGVRSLPPQVRDVIGYHHERVDGRGYPAGLAGDRIPLLARIVAVADCYDAMRSERPYRQPVSPHQAIQELLRCAGSQFDEDVVAALVRIAEKVEAAVYQTASEEAPPASPCELEDTTLPLA